MACYYESRAWQLCDSSDLERQGENIDLNLQKLGQEVSKAFESVPIDLCSSILPVCIVNAGLDIKSQLLSLCISMAEE